MSAEELETQHTFDGVNVSRTGNLFQFCDITDPLIKKILATKDIRTTCAPTFQGWYHVGTWAKATVILKHKMNTIIGNETPDDTIYQRIIGWPELWDDQEIAATYKEEVNNRQVHEQKRKEHDVMHQVRWAARNPRYAFEKMEAANTQEEDVEAGDMIEDVDIPEDMTENPVTAREILDDESENEENYIEDDEEEAFEGDGDETWDEEEALQVSSNQASHSSAPFGGLYRV